MDGSHRLRTYRATMLDLKNYPFASPYLRGVFFAVPDDPCVVDSTDALELKAVPKRMLILGGGIGGTHASDMIGEIALAIEMGADAVDIGKTIHPHPTLGESIGMAAEVAHGSGADLPLARKLPVRILHEKALWTPSNGREALLIFTAG
ncbi:pyridine nucleotide-disulfide oxidoreductase dimerization region [Polaromonas naphthalenivorans CJ2]|uniref:Pyridine nucleotide-disulfide oxidoreductase dimerization region n=1 Tax=Polaromonas naphthalenivorans (strain CJ2) TaxID=365044 RepID=A1VN68_POLNA|nr:pyridine nucleotide-disulfide oxidoreductase dimerization region [Polaromonas naphthalenivorans CJ2]